MTESLDHVSMLRLHDDGMRSDTQPGQLVEVPIAAPQQGNEEHAKARRRGGPLLRLLLAAILVAGIGLGAAVALWGNPPFPGGSPGGSAQEVRVVPMDTARIAELEASVRANPSDTASLLALGEAFLFAGRWEPAESWLSELVAIEPGNAKARAELGTAQFNLGKLTEAKATWLAGIESAPDDAQLHYDLGFWYANSDAPNLSAARGEWERVVTLAPGSNVAAAAQTHLAQIAQSGSPASTAAANGK